MIIPDFFSNALSEDLCSGSLAMRYRVLKLLEPHCDPHARLQRAAPTRFLRSNNCCVFLSNNPDCRAWFLQAVPALERAKKSCVLLFDDRPSQVVPWTTLPERLRARLGDGAVLALAPQDDHRPECAMPLAGCLQ